jgi:hypothetical protein
MRFTPGHAETWVEGAVVLHNPNAIRPLDPGLLVGATHEFLQPDGTIMSLLPNNPPYASHTIIWVAEEGSTAAGTPPQEWRSTRPCGSRAGVQTGHAR